MKKTAKTIISILMALLLLASLPISAMAEGEPHVTEDTENNTTSNAIIDTGVTVTTNSAPVWENNGSIGTNNAPINTNNGSIGTNNYINIQTNNGTVTTANGGYIETNNGTITTANGTSITTNAGDIGTSSASIGTNNGKVGVSNNYINTNTGTVTDNNGKIENSSGTVVNNNGKGKDGIGTNTGTVTNSAGYIYTNNGQVGTVGTKGQTVNTSGQPNLVNNQAVKNEDGTYQEGTGVVDVNHGFLINNGDYAAKDKDSGTLNTNEGYVYNNYGTITTNKNKVEQNGGTIGQSQGNIRVNQSGASLGTNGKDGYIYVNIGKVDTNDGKIDINPGGTIGTNNGTVGEFDYGTIETNNGTITESHGKVVTNGITGVVNHGGGGTIDNNFGTFNSYDGNTYLGLSWGSDTKSLTLIDGAVVKGTQKNLDEAAAEVTAAGPTRSGYRLTGYTWLTSDGTKVTDTANYTMNAPTWLKLLWEKIITAVESNEPEATPVKAAAIPTTVAAEDVKVGTTIRAKGQIFKVVEMDDGSMTIVTMGKLSGKDMEDLTAFLAKYFTPEQIELLLGEPELISGELAEKLFGGNTGHIVFKAARNLFAQ